ncbi:MAG: HAMP domain-containing sensor histidine kinase [Polyangiaceae bacterium]
MDRLDHLVTELLDVSRIAAGRLDLQTRGVDLAAIARAVVERFEDDARSRGAKLSCEAPIPVIGTWDELRIDQIVTNLLSNALKYGRGSPIIVRVHGTPQEAILEVHDGGAGVPEEAQDRIFERFERMPTAGTIAGFGLGLWIVRQIVERHGGTIRLVSRLGQGSTFIVTLPREVR